MRMLRVVLVFSLLAIPARPADKDDVVGFGNSFYDHCASAETLLDKGNSSDAETLHGMFCLGFAEGLTMGIMAADGAHGQHTFCEPDNVTNLQIVRIVRKYIADHPEKAHEVTAVLAVEALSRAFPCGK